MKPNVLDNFGHGHNWEVWLSHLKGKENLLGIELGTFRGASAEWVMRNIFTHTSSIYHCIDTFEGSAEHKINSIDCSENESFTRVRLKDYKNCLVWKQYSNKFLLSMAPSYEKVDFIYVDAAHDSMNVLRDGVLSFDLLKPGGTMIFDDYNWREMPREIDNPRMGIDAFLNCYADSIEIVAKKSQVVVKKL